MTIWEPFFLLEGTVGMIPSFLPVWRHLFVYLHRTPNWTSYFCSPLGNVWSDVHKLIFSGILVVCIVIFKMSFPVHATSIFLELCFSQDVRNEVTFVWTWRRFELNLVFSYHLEGLYNVLMGQLEWMIKCDLSSVLVALVGLMGPLHVSTPTRVLYNALVA